MFNRNKFAQILKNISETFENQRDFSKKSEINRTYLSQYMNMKLDKPPKPDILKKVAENSKGVTTYEELMAICGYTNIDNFLKEKYEYELSEFAFSEKEYRNIITTFCNELFNFCRIELSKAEKRVITILCNFLLDYMTYHKSNIVDTDYITIEWLFDENNIPDDIYPNFKENIIHVSQENTKMMLSLLNENKIITNGQILQSNLVTKIDSDIEHSKEKSIPIDFNAEEREFCINLFNSYIDDLFSYKKNLKAEQYVNKIYDTNFSEKQKEDFEKAFLTFLINTVEILEILFGKDYLKVVEKYITKSEPSNTYISTDSVKIPVLGSIPAGIPIELIEDILDYEDISEEMLKGGKEYFALKVKGSSMWPKYLDGDTIIVLKQNDCESGQDAIVMVNGNDGTFKRVIKKDNGIILEPINQQEYNSVSYSNEDIEKLPIKILGVVKEIRRKI